MPVTAFKPGRLAGAMGHPILDLAAEVIEPGDLEALLERAQAERQKPAATRRAPRAYIGFEPSGTAHVGWIVCTDMIQRLVDAGFDVTILMADWHAQINDKLGGDLHAIRRCAEYMTDAFEALGVSKDSVTYRFAAEFARDEAYWSTVIQVAKHTTLARMRRAMTIMGRQEDEGDSDVSKFLYPAMQVADMFHLDVDVAYGGLDQRHAHMLARDVARKIGAKAPVAIHTPLVPSLRGEGRMDAMATGDGPAEKMSKSDPDTGIFLHDELETIARKIKQAHCPPREVEGNPVLELLRLVVWPRLKDGLRVGRPEKFGGPLSFATYDAVVQAYAAGDLHPMDLKSGVTDALEAILAPVREYFQAHPENLRFVQALKRTR